MRITAPIQSLPLYKDTHDVVGYEDFMGEYPKTAILEPKVDPLLKVQTYTIETSMGSVTNRSALPFLDDAEIKEFNTVGYTGKNSKGEPMTRQELLNSLGKGTFDVTQTKWDNGTFGEAFIISRATTDRMS